MQTLHQFKNQGLKTYAGAVARLAKVEHLLVEAKATCFVAVQDGKYFPVAHVRAPQLAFILARNGIFVTG